MRNIFKKKKAVFVVASPVNGECIQLEEVADAVFNTKMLGEGVAFKLADSFIYAPCDGVITLITSTKHAFGILSDNGAELLVHVGLDTVNLNGKGFRVLVNQGDRVRKGMAVIEVDNDFMKKQQIDLTTPLVITNSDDYAVKIMGHYGYVKVGDPILEVNKK